MKAAASAQSRGKRSPGALLEPRPRKKGEVCKSGLARKVKCSGNQPCSRCEELHSECTYNEQSQPDTENFDPQPAYQDLEVTVLRMNRICDQMQQSMGRFGLTHPSRSDLQRTKGNQHIPRLSKPLTLTDFRHNLSLTRDAMKAKGLQSSLHTQDGLYSVAADAFRSADTLINLLQTARPILELGHEKVTQIFTIFKEEVYPLYPCISLELGYEAVDAVFSLGKDCSYESTSNVDIIDVEITKAVAAIALLLKGDTENILASDLESQLVWGVDSCLDQVKPQVEDIVMAALLEPQESYISTVISLDRNLSEIWTLVNAVSSQSNNKEEQIDFLDFQLQKLVDKVPIEEFKPLEPTVVSPPWLQAGLKRFYWLRVHHIRILIQAGKSGSISDSVSNPKYTRTLVTAAAQSVDMHMEMVNAGGISPLMLPTAIKLLLISLSVMLFAVSHFPEDYGSLYSKHFQTAIDILSDVQIFVQDPDLNIPGTLEVLEKVAETSQISHSQRSTSLINRKECTSNILYRGEAFGDGGLFEELPTPDSEFFSMLQYGSN
ncbi:hypothetical protein N7472_001302 [Penicillium cf. griseofulvum]|uniref:Zn(2)-C6 fungal-type domain-containing protein n=1 Tax=Penicillium cf. griseofulvum TaxID=2972120 RepID=A0A9W9N1R8_9EURO|nr:hypothetical protein N7472_001302 [Penicillium cf. griseofulvum]